MTPTVDLLLVEDDLPLARALRRSFVARGLRVLHVPRCAAALALHGHFRAAIFDIDLPDGNGAELARELLSRGVVGRALFYTACSNPDQLARARAIGPLSFKSSPPTALIELFVPRSARETCVSSQL